MNGRTIILMGLRGSGKTTVGAMVAKELDGSFADLDDLVACAESSATGRAMTVGEILKSRGEPAFRALECTALRTALSAHPAVLSLGGGTPTHQPSRELLKSDRTLVIYLRATPGTLRSRLQGTDLSARPSLTGRPVLEEIDAVFAARDPVYRSLAHHIIEVDHLTRAQAVAAVVQAAGT